MVSYVVPVPAAIPSGHLVTSNFGGATQILMQTKNRTRRCGLGRWIVLALTASGHGYFVHIRPSVCADPDRVQEPQQLQPKGRAV